jgi:hypothetical protein
MTKRRSSKKSEDSLLAMINKTERGRDERSGVDEILSVDDGSSDQIGSLFSDTSSSGGTVALLSSGDD